MSRAPRAQRRGGAQGVALATGAVAIAIAAIAWLGATRAATEERTVCEWVVEPRYVDKGALKVEPQRVCRIETVERPGLPDPPTGLRPADGGRSTGIIVESEPAAPAPPKE